MTSKWTGKFGVNNSQTQSGISTENIYSYYLEPQNIEYGILNVEGG
jgi:hypothetical protein